MIRENLRRTLALIACVTFAILGAAEATAQPVSQAVGVATQANATATTLQASAPQTVLTKLPHFYARVFTGLVNTGGVFTRTTTLTRTVAIGDSVGNAKPAFIIPRLKGLVGGGIDGGGLFSSTPILTGGATAATNVTVNTYWFNGQWTNLPGGGTVEYLQGGGRPFTTQLKIAYVLEPGAGTFKIQTNSGAGYVDEPSYTNVSAANATTTAAVITIPKTLGSYSVKVVGLTGTVHVLFASWERTDYPALAHYDFTVGGLNLVNSINTPAAIVNAVFADLLPQVGFSEWKDPVAYQSSFTTFLGTLKTASANTDWIIIGTSPVSDPPTDAQQVVDNAFLKGWAASNSAFYFDGYSPFGSYATMVAMGWNGDGTHPSQTAQAYVSSLLWTQIGLDNIPLSYANREWVAITPRALGAMIFGPPDAPGGTIDGSSQLDLILKSARHTVIKDASGNFVANFQASGSPHEFGAAISLGTPNTGAGPTLRAPAAANGSGLYSSDYSPGNGSAVMPFGASKFILGKSNDATVPFWTSGTGSPEGVVTARIGSLYSRIDGGAATSLYVKESTTGNTGWIAK